MVNKPLIRPAISGGGTWPGGGRLTSHECALMIFVLVAKLIHVDLAKPVGDFSGNKR